MKQCECYRDVVRQTVEGRDFCIKERHGVSGVAVMAPHGGGIEPGTDIIADAIAGEEHAFYAFNGLLPKGNALLHISSKRFDEPRALNMVRQADTVVTVHGCRNELPLIWVGGLDYRLKESVIENLRLAGFDARLSTKPGMRGIARSNLCNRGSCGKGLQLEISRQLRRELLRWDRSVEALHPTPLFHTFVGTIRYCLTDLCDT